MLIISGIYSFQKPTPQHTELPTELKLEKKEAETLMNEGLWDQAIQQYKRVQQKCIERNLNSLANDLYEDLLTVIILRDDIEMIVKKVQIDSIYSEQQNPHLEGIYNGALAHLFTFYGEIDSFEQYYTKACHLYSKEHRFRLEGNLNTTLAFEFYMLDDLQNAQRFLKKAEVILTKKLKPQNLDLPTIYNVQTLIYAHLGEYDKALRSNLISINTLESDDIASPLDLAYEYNNLATIYSFLKDYNNSLNYYLKALNLIENSNEYPKEESASLIYNIAATYSKQNNYTLAKEASLKALSYLNSSKKQSKGILVDYINNYHQLVSCYQKFNELDSALFYIQKAETINKIYPYRISTTYRFFSQVFLTQKEFAKANKYALKAISKGLEAYGTKSEFISAAYNILSDINIAQSNYKEALSNTQKALEAISIDFSDPEGVNNPELAKVLNKGELLSTLRRKLTILKQLYKQENPLVTGDDIFATAKLTAEALEQMNRKMKDVNSKRGSLNRQALPLFEAAISSALDVVNRTGNKEYLNEAFMLSERSKSMLMADAMQGEMASSLGGIPDSLLKKLDNLQEAFADAEKQRFEAKTAGDAEMEKEMEGVVFDCKHHLNLMEHSLEEQYPKYKTLKMKSSVASVTDIQAALSTNTTFIEYFEGENDIYAFAINKKEVSIEVIPKEDDFKLNIFSFQKSLMDIKAFTTQPGIVYNAFVKKSHYFYTKLIQNAIKGNMKTERLIIVPDGQLGYLPFEVLITESMPLLKQGTNKGADFSKLPYLLRDYKISYNYSGTIMIAQQAKKGNIINGDILALAPSYASTETPNWRKKREVDLRKKLIELPGAIDEVAKLEELYSGQFYIGQQANETVFKDGAPKHGILHLAMHGLVDQKDPEYSGLALTEDQSKDEDNFLYAYEIKQLGLQAGLVVLSACETGIGKYQRGEGVVSIGRGFMYAGAPSLLMTLWSLNDQSGAVIIEQFYKNLSEGMEKDEAIRQAKLYYLDNYPAEYTHPFMWAAFVQVGDYSSIQINHKSNWNYFLIGGAAILLTLLLFFTLKMKKNT
jgi:CHAT domain-containing protein/tetratricopeptide (TPR) repeat protein